METLSHDSHDMSILFELAGIFSQALRQVGSGQWDRSRVELARPALLWSRDEQPTYTWPPRGRAGPGLGVGSTHRTFVRRCTVFRSCLGMYINFQREAARQHSALASLARIGDWFKGRLAHSDSWILGQLRAGFGWLLSRLYHRVPHQLE